MNTDSENSTQYTGFTLGLALVDAVPVLFFLISGLLLWQLFPSRCFLIGIIACTAAGCGKVLWKILLSADINHFWLNRQFRFLMPAGFGLLLLSLIINAGAIHWAGMIRAVISLPSLIFFIAGGIGMTAMAVFSGKMDNSSRSSWIEQFTNLTAQLMFLLGILFIVWKP